MFPFRRRKNTAETRFAFQLAAENWLRLPRSAHPDAFILQAKQEQATFESVDNVLHDVENAPPSLSVPSLQGSGSESLSGVAPHLLPLLSPGAFETEPYRVLGHLVGQMHTEANLQVLAISSPGSGDGKTSTTISLAGILAREPQKRVLLVESELRRPSVARYLGLKPTTEGLAGMLLEPTLTLERVVQHCLPFNFDVLLAGHSSASPYDLLKLPHFGALIDAARRQYDYVIVDTPPLLPFADCRLMEKWIDGLLIVVAAHQTPRKLLAEALEIVDPSKLVGLVLNKDEQQTRRYGYAYHYYAPSARRQRQDGRPF